MMNTSNPEDGIQSLTFAHKGAGEKLSAEQRAWDLAKELCGSDAIFSEIAAKAQWIKGVLQTAKERD
jgi:hypothetical protein